MQVMVELELIGDEQQFFVLKLEKAMKDMVSMIIAKLLSGALTFVGR